MDAEDRKRYGPFRPAFGELAPPGILEDVLEAKPTVDVESVLICQCQGSIITKIRSRYLSNQRNGKIRSSFPRPVPDLMGGSHV